MSANVIAAEELSPISYKSTVLEFTKTCQSPVKKSEYRARFLMCITYINSIKAQKADYAKSPECWDKLENDLGPGPIMEAIFSEAKNKNYRNYPVYQVASEIIDMVAKECTVKSS